jgi:hypothetical protein
MVWSIGVCLFGGKKRRWEAIFEWEKWICYGRVYEIYDVVDWIGLDCFVE